MESERSLGFWVDLIESSDNYIPVDAEIEGKDSDYIIYYKVGCGFYIITSDFHKPARIRDISYYYREYPYITYYDGLYFYFETMRHELWESAWEDSCAIAPEFCSRFKED